MVMPRLEPGGVPHGVATGWIHIADAFLTSTAVTALHQRGLDTPWGATRLFCAGVANPAFACMHTKGGRFVPPPIVEQFGVEIPKYPGVAQHVRLDPTTFRTTCEDPTTDVFAYGNIWRCAKFNAVCIILTVFVL